MDQRKLCLSYDFFNTAILIVFYREDKKLPKWGIVGLISSSAGYILMLMSPGNFKRAVDLKTPFFLDVFWERFEIIKDRTKEFILPVMIIAFVLFVVVCFFTKERRKTICLSALFILGAGVAVGSMIVSPRIPPRTMFGAVVFLIVALSVLLVKISELSFIKALSISVLALFVVLFAHSYLYQFNLLSQTHLAWQERITYINQQKEQGVTHIMTPAIIPLTPYDPLYGLTDLDPDTSGQFNPYIALYYDIDSIKKK